MASSGRSGVDVAIVSAASFLQIAIQFGFAAVMSRLYAATAVSDAYFAALVVPVTVAAIATGSLTYVLVPELVKQLESSDSNNAWRLASFSGVFTFGVSLSGSLLIYSFSDRICSFLGYADPLTPKLLQILSWQVLLTSLITWGTAVHHGLNRFLAPALGGVLGTGAILILALNFGSTGIEVIAWSMNIGSAISVFVCTITLLPRMAWPSGQLGIGSQLLARLWPLLAGSLFLRLDPLVDRVLADRLELVGAVTYIDRGQRLLMALITIGTSSLAIIAFPRLANAVKEITGFAAEFSLALRRTLLVVLPITIGFAFFAPEIVKDLLEGGEWTAKDTKVLSGLLLTMLGMFVGASLGEILARAFYVQGDTKTPTVVGAISLVLGLVVKISLYSSLGLAGIAIGMSLYYLTSAALMAFILAQRVGYKAFTDLGGPLVQAIVASVGACGCSYVIYAIGVGRTWLAGPVGVVAFAAILWTLGNQDARLAVDLTVKRLLRSRQSG